MKTTHTRRSISGKYSSAVIDYQPGLHRRVLKNKLGITKAGEMHDREIIDYVKAVEQLPALFSIDTSFTAEDVCFIHKAIFENIYDWAGKYRNVELSKDGFTFARAIYVASSMEIFSETLLKPATPPGAMSPSELSSALAKIHVEFIIIHPFREGNGRTIRLLLSLIAQQAGYAGLDFGFIKSRGKENKRYITAIQQGVNGDFSLMQEIIDRALTR